MEKKCKIRWQLGLKLRSLLMAAAFVFLSFTLAEAESSAPSLPSMGVKLETLPHGQVVMDNGLVRIILSNPEGDIIGIKYNNIDNLLEIHNELDNRGYWDVVWNYPNKTSATDSVKGTSFKVITATNEQLEISFIKTWNASTSNPSSAPLNVEKRYIMRRGQTGFYAYGIFERIDGWPAIDIDQIRIVYKLHKEKFHYMAVTDGRQRVMPMPEDRTTGQPLAFPEAVLLTNPINLDFKGEVDDKYQYSTTNEENIVHGWTCQDPHVGFWMITPSNEFRTAGPIKQDLTSHVGPITLSMFVSTHYAGKEVGMSFEEGEAWKKVFGPVFVYLNSMPTRSPTGSPYGSPTGGPSASPSSAFLWENAKKQMEIETNSWPYSFVQSEDFPIANRRGAVSGQLLVQERYTRKRLVGADSAYVGLAAPGELGSWQRESKGYQFWTRADNKGYFSIEKVRPGNYSLYAWVPGFIGDYKYDYDITVMSETNTKLNRVLLFQPPRQGPTLWEIGIPDRTAAEFYVPDPQPTLMNRLYQNQNSNKFRQYGLWERYAELYPNQDLIYTVGVDDYRRDWFFAHVTRHVGDGKYNATTWQIVFRLPGQKRVGNYTLQLALASAMDSRVEVRFNDPGVKPTHFSTGPIGKDNAIARHGIHGLYWLFSINVDSELLVENGNNTIYLTQAKDRGPFEGVMYDYIRLEAPSFP